MIDGIKERTFCEARKVIFKKGDPPGNCFYCIDSGTIELWDQINGSLQKVHTLTKG